jgi:cathepsin L
MKLALALAMMVAVAAAADHSFLWEQWRSEHKKTYTSALEAMGRFEIFKKNHEMIEAHNARYEAGEETYSMGHNQFSDLTQEEFAARQQMCEKEIANKARHPSKALRGLEAPDSIDWTQKGAVTPVKNQGQCGSCWAFSTTGSTEGAWEIAKGQLVSLSEQELVDCCAPEGSHGCEGGLMDFGFQCIMDLGGICTESAYPYEARDDQCRSSKCTEAVTISSFEDVPQSDIEALKSAVAKGPVSIAIEADQSCFQFYSGGVMSDSGCGTNLDHGVLLVGYGTDNGQDYWKVKNSWGASWGEEGYIRLGRTQEGPQTCGLALSASYPVV